MARQVGTRHARPFTTWPIRRPDDGAVDWIPTQNAGTITWEFPERPNPQRNRTRDDGRRASHSPELLDFNKGTAIQAWRDHYYTQAAVHISKQHKPNLLLFHLLDLDSTNHSYADDPRRTTRRSR